MIEARPFPLTVRGAKEATLEPGTITVLIGPNGAGKTHWLEQLAGLRDPDGLRICYGGEPLWLPRKRGAPRLNRRALLSYAYAAQSPEEQLMARTAEEELRAALKPYRLTAEQQEERIRCALSAVGWDAREWRERSTFRMSGGERRRLALACLLAPPARWLLLDEPTAGLDAAGQRLLADRLREKRGEGCGLVIVTHDSEWAFRLADRVLLLSPDGELRERTPGEWLAEPRRWAEAGLPLPPWAAAASSLVRAGLPPELALDPAAAAAAWARLERTAPPAGLSAEPPAGLSAAPPAGLSAAPAAGLSAAPAAGLSAAPPPGLSAAPPAGLSAAPPAGLSAAPPAGMSAAPPAGMSAAPADPLASFDPKALWLSYVCLSLALFSLRGWVGVGIGAMLTGLALALSRVPLRPWRGVLAGFALFSLTVSALSGVGRRGSFHADAFLLSLHSMARTFLVMLLGLGLAVSVTSVRLKRSLEQLLSVRGTLPVPAQKIVLTVTLLLRFIPVFLSEWERFARFAVARGKETGRSAGTALRRIRSTSLPFLLALFRMGEQIAFALESRGVGRRTSPALARTDRWRRRDTALVLVSLAVAAALWRYL